MTNDGHLELLYSKVINHFFHCFSGGDHTEKIFEGM